MMIIVKDQDFNDGNKVGSSESSSLSQHPELLKLAIFLFLGNAAGYTE